jgi:cytoskeletal protein CcmA (bactofilin family)
MWGKNKESNMGFSAGNTTLISRSTEVVGDIHFTGSLEVEGRVRGNIYAEEGTDARVRVMEKGLVEGQISVPTVVINGSVNGDVHSGKHIELAAKATVQGNVHYHLIEMVKGSQVNGNLLYSGKEAKGKPAEKLIKEAPEKAAI